MTQQKPLLTRKELAWALRHSTAYVYQMEKRGFKMPGGTATLQDAIRWLLKHGRPFSFRQI